MKTLFIGLTLLAALSGASAAPAENQQPADTQAATRVKVKWVNPPTQQFPGVTHRTFRSASMKCDVGFSVYLPPDYATSGKRLPVIYSLHGANGDEGQMHGFAETLDRAIRAGDVPPMIMVLPNAGAFSFYSDSVDGSLMVETMIIKELIPFVDEHYRTVTSRQGRAVLGFSMGGFGALKLGFQYPELFGCVVAYMPALVTPESFASPERLAWYRQMFGGKPEALQAVHPMTLARQRADRVRGVLPIRIIVGSEERNASRKEAIHQLLDELKIAHEYEVLQGVGHSAGQCMEREGAKGYKFIARHLSGANAELPGAAAAPAQNEPPSDAKGGAGVEVKWVNPPTQQFPGVTYRTFRSASMKCDAGFSIYLPPDYATSGKRLPVVYSLHGADNENQLVKFTPILDRGIRAGEVPPMILVLPNGGAFSFYSDSVDGTIMVETMIVKELIPFVDAHYRTVASRQGRAIQGFSMGGFGALKLGFQYPELFGCVVALMPALVTPESFESPERLAWYRRMFGGKPEALQAVHPMTLVKERADRIRGILPIRLVVGSEETHFARKEELHHLLDELKIAHEYEVFEGVGHNSGPCMEREGVKGYQFISRRLTASKAAPTAR